MINFDLAAGSNNPSSLHDLGRQAKDCLDKARAMSAEAISVRPKQLTFVPGATAALALVLSNFKKVAVAKTEHRSVMANISKPHFLDVDNQGQIDCQQIILLDDKVEALVVSAINAESGAWQSWPKIKSAVNQLNIQRRSKSVNDLKVIIDASQAGMSERLVPSRYAADALIINLSKIGGNQQSALVWLKPGLKIKPLFGGGSQENGLWPGTENLVAAEAGGLALRKAQGNIDNFVKHTRKLSQSLIEGLSKAGIKYKVVAAEQRAPHILVVLFEGQDNERLAYNLDTSGFAVGLGSACHASDGEPSPALLAMGYSHDQARSALRFGFGLEHSLEDIDSLLVAIQDILS